MQSALIRTGSEPVDGPSTRQTDGGGMTLELGTTSGASASDVQYYFERWWDYKGISISTYQRGWDDEKIYPVHNRHFNYDKMLAGGTFLNFEFYRHFCQKDDRSSRLQKVTN